MTNRGKMRLGWAVILLSCVGLLAYAHYVQYILFIEPCPLCILQRLGFYGLGIVALIALIHGPQGKAAVLYGILAGIPGLYGVGVAARHTWLQMNPPEFGTASCGAGLEYMMETVGWLEALGSAFEGSGDCSMIDWSFLGLGMPTWTLIWFIGLVAGIAWGVVKFR
jgi:disulfide bond formation protein DsbB